MIERQHGKIVVECDSCGDTLETETGDFSKAREVMQREDWKVRSEGKSPNTVWLHGCPKCGVPEVGLFARNERLKRGG